MNCPACNNAMIVLELDMVEIDHCVKCGGIWLDHGELEQLFDDQRQADMVIDSFRKKETTGEKLRLCPICLKKMEKAAASDKIIIDRCSGHHGLWFDKNELLQILTDNLLGKEHKVIRLLSEMFSKDKERQDGN